MNPALQHALAAQHRADLLAARRATSGRSTPRPAAGALRRRLGLGLVEAGLKVLATAPPPRQAPTVRSV